MSYIPLKDEDGNIAGSVDIDRTTGRMVIEQFTNYTGPLAFAGRRNERFIEAIEVRLIGESEEKPFVMPLAAPEGGDRRLGDTK